ncbi:Kinesin-like protein KIF3B [Durusdinium trenchii]|uniref:Kinesin-like protein KIF3B n=1 Tax=Durusdinium trenchii TaxID=1381693 RepID=A0ABP0NJD2_9DINO
MQVELLRSSVAQAQELSSRSGSHEVIATLRVDQLFGQSPSACDYEFPLVASRCLVRLKPNRKESRRECERPQVAFALELSSYAEIFQEAEPYLLDLFAAACWDASETPTVEGARQFWAHLGWQIC